MQMTGKLGRRAILQRGLLLVAGALGLSLAPTGEARQVTGDVRLDGTSLKLYGRHWHRHSQDRRPGEPPATGDRMLVYGELLDGPEGSKVGEFYAVCFCAHAPLGISPVAAANIEWHTFSLTDGTIVGTGTTRPAGQGESVYAIVGGTGRYAGAQGTYTARQAPQELGGNGTAEFTLTLIV